MQISNRIGDNHEPVLLKETLKYLEVDKLAHSKKAKFVDATLGMGGHTLAMVCLGGHVLGIEQDLKSLEVARNKLEKALRAGTPSGLEACPPPSQTRGSFTLFHGNFKDLEKIAREYEFRDVDGILFDLGISSYQLEGKGGFSYRDSGVFLDMRIDKDSQEVKAADLLNILNEGQLREMFSKVMPFYESKILSDRIVTERRVKKIETVSDFLAILDSLPGSKKSLHPATLPFLALRITVNSELENLEKALPQAFRLLGKNGRLQIISFHSEEDTIVKKFFKEKEKEGAAEIITEKPIIPDTSEVERNPRSKSAKMRVLEKI